MWLSMPPGMQGVLSVVMGFASVGTVVVVFGSGRSIESSVLLLFRPPLSSIGSCGGFRKFAKPTIGVARCV